jgi:hypothetical protein
MSAYHPVGKPDARKRWENGMFTKYGNQIRAKVFQTGIMPFDIIERHHCVGLRRLSAGMRRGEGEREDGGNIAMSVT